MAHTLLDTLDSVLLENLFVISDDLIAVRYESAAARHVGKWHFLA